MKIINRVLKLASIFLLTNCINGGVENTPIEIKKSSCPCDSSCIFWKDSSKIIKCFIGKSLIEIEDISMTRSNDTFAVSHYIYFDSNKKWRIQEGMGVAANNIINPETAFYCDYKKESNTYKLTFIKNTDVRLGSNGPKFKSLIGTKAVIGNDTFHSKDTVIYLPKEKFKGIIKLEKVMISIYKNQEGIFKSPMLIDADNMIKYGNILEQYKAIMENCDLSIPQQAKEK